MTGRGRRVCSGGSVQLSGTIMTGCQLRRLGRQGRRRRRGRRCGDVAPRGRWGWWRAGGAGGYGGRRHPWGALGRVATAVQAAMEAMAAMAATAAMEEVAATPAMAAMPMAGGLAIVGGTVNSRARLLSANVRLWGWTGRAGRPWRQRRPRAASTPVPRLSCGGAGGGGEWEAVADGWDAGGGYNVITFAFVTRGGKKNGNGGNAARFSRLARR